MSSFRLFSPKFPCSSPIFKTLTSPSIIPVYHITKNQSFIKFTTIQSIPTKPFAPNCTSQSLPDPNTLQPIQELPKKLQEIIKLFQSVQDPRAKYEQLLFYGKTLKPLETKFKIDQNKVKGCVSQVWLRAYFDDSGKKNVVFEADSDSVLTKGLAALLVKGLSGHSVEEILKVSPDFVTLLGLHQSLTPSRNNGFLNMLKLMQKKAVSLHLEGENGVDSVQENQNHVEEVGSGLDIVNPIEDSSNGDLGSRNGSMDVGVLGSRGQRILNVLTRELESVELEVKDVSYQHAGHAGVRGSDGETHFNLKVVSKEFEGKSMVKRHRLIYSLLDDELQSGLHALSIEAKTPAEFDH
uniref:sufE-like protein 1, chloroplastic/mitochondrial n=1 Tax=Erigeron canadensis TaxID=72917 RepID=UPI001CB8EAC6|nr:sufE-like protein 1, chloroplastic/mitochondrial [Erigeron canadensis]